MAAEKEGTFSVCEFLIAAASPAQFPPHKIPEVAFAGRSNAGKSSLINAIAGRKNLARASNRPGRTQEIIFFSCGKDLMLADLPGYGFAKAPRTAQEHWNNLVHDYLQSRANLRCVYLLLDSRHGALANDLAMMQFLDRAGVSYQIVLTKADQLRTAEREPRVRQVAAMLAKHPAARTDVFMTSAEKGLGIEDLRKSLLGLAR